MTKPLLDNNKRKFQRIPFISNVQITIDGQNQEFRLLDISLKGVLIEYTRDIEINSDKRYPLSLTLSKEVVINMQAKMTHIEENRLGFEWVNIDLESLTALRRLLELNLSDVEEVNRELAELIPL